jgi:hypothetical protein
MRPFRFGTPAKNEIMDVPEARPYLRRFCRIAANNSHQELPVLHHLLAIEPNVEVAADAIDVGF